MAEGAGAGAVDWQATLSAEVVLWADGGGKARGAATRPVHGRDAVAKFLMASTRFAPAETTRVDPASINGEPGLIIRDGDRPVAVMTVELEDEQISTLRVVANPDKLRHIGRS